MRSTNVKTNMSEVMFDGIQKIGPICGNCNKSKIIWRIGGE